VMRVYGTAASTTHHIVEGAEGCADSMYKLSWLHCTLLPNFVMIAAVWFCYV
jgi:hypothetical protein